MAEGEELSKKQAAQEGQIRKLRAQIREFEEEKKGLITKLQSNLLWSSIGLYLITTWTVAVLMDGKTLDNELEVVEGMKLDKGYISLFHHQPRTIEIYDFRSVDNLLLLILLHGRRTEQVGKCARRS
ncbi:golgin candidate 5 [Prunus dulcis]|uniref:Golgin candidate 5 n=1 Tax=Prunus dulcis TaxID=3755 RepID=A0A4Y1R4T3_PRUDU|nr:golgin candidate 5 [Prunus dulcis]